MISESWLRISYVILLGNSGQASSNLLCNFAPPLVCSVPQQLAFRKQGEKSAHFLCLLSQKAWRQPHACLLTVMVLLQPAGQGEGHLEPILQLRNKANPRMRGREKGQAVGGAEGNGAARGTQLISQRREMQNYLHLVCLPSSFLHPNLRPGSQTHFPCNRNPPGTWRVP